MGELASSRKERGLGREAASNRQGLQCKISRLNLRRVFRGAEDRHMEASNEKKQTVTEVFFENNQLKELTGFLKRDSRPRRETGM